METTLENPVIKDEGELLRQMAHDVDQGKDETEVISSGNKPEDRALGEGEAKLPDDSNTDNSEIESARPERARDPVTGKFIKTAAEIAADASSDATEAVGTPEVASTERSESEYAAKVREKKEKEQVRLDKTWENVNRQKEEIEQRRQELERREQEFVRPQVQSQQRQFSSKQLFDASQEFKVTAKKALESGDYDTFNQQSDLAEKAFENAAQFYELEQKEAQEFAQHKHTKVWEQNIKEAFKADPELANPDSELSKEVQNILEVQGKKLWVYPDGFNDAVQIAKMRIRATGYDNILEANKKLKAEIDRLNGLTAVTPGGVTSGPRSRNFNDMSSAEQDAYLMSEAARIDAGR